MQAGPFGSQGNNFPDFVFCAGISTADGQTLSMNPMILPLPIFFSADAQNNGKMS